MITRTRSKGLVSFSGKIAAVIFAVYTVITSITNYPSGASAAILVVWAVPLGVLLAGAVAYLLGHAWGWFVMVPYAALSLVSIAFLATRDAAGWFVLAFAFLLALLLCLVLPPIRYLPRAEH